MKMFVALYALALSVSSLASSGETKTFVYDGSQSSVELLLRGEKTHTEYTYEPRQTICTRTEVVGYRTVCYGPQGANADKLLPPPPPRPYPVPRPGPYPMPVPPPRVCHQEPVYRTVSYPCIQTVRIPHEIKDYDTEARVVINVTKLPELMTVGETFKVRLDGEELSLETIGSKKFFIVLNNKVENSSMSGSVKFLDTTYNVELIEAAPLTRVFNMNNIAMNGDVLAADIGAVTTTKNLGFSLRVDRAPIFGSNTTLFDRELTLDEAKILNLATGSQMTVDFNTVGIQMGGGRHLITARVFLKLNGRLLNDFQFGELEAGRTLVLKR
ncbi:MAG: hypothetical protein AB7I27_02800 [Bacteriovoracaceae bacterium]